jgi:hypothetical protein
MRPAMSNTESNYSNLLQDKLLKIKISKLERDFLNFKKAYPNYSESMSIPGEHNLERWVQTLKDIYFKNHQSGMPWKQALDSSTENWNILEKNDFSRWVNFYQERGDLKYKKASWYVSPEGEVAEEDTLGPGNTPYAGYFVPNPPQHGNRNVNIHSDVDFAKEADANDISSAEKRKLVERHKKKLISRLDSVERLLRSDEGDLLAESESDSLMDSIHALKRKILKLNKKTSGDLFYKDLIIREANTLAKNGLYKAASYLYVIAEDKKIEDSSAIPPASPPPPSVSTGAGPDDSPNEVSGMLPPQSPGPDSNSRSRLTDLPGITSENATGAAAVAASLGSGFFADDQNNLEDDLMVYDENLSDDLSDYLMVTEAQEATPAPTPPAAPSSEITVSEKDFDSQLNSVLSGVTIEDIVKKIEEISKVFKTREIPRQLAIVDMMLDRLGLASFFPSLSEATNKALESNNYILTRIEGILTQLSGAVKTKSLDLTHEAVTPPQAEDVKEKLQEEENIEKERKEMRKELSDKALEERAKEDTPELEVTEEDLSAPAPEAGAPAASPAAAPAAAPAAPPPPQAPPPAV